MNRRIVSFFVLAILIMTMAVTVFADNEHNNEHCYDIGSVMITQYAPTNIDGYARKYTSSSIYFYPKGTLEAVYIRVLGSAYDDGTGAQNMTYKNGQVVEAVVCNIGTQYRIHNLVYENNLSWCTLSAYPNVFSGVLKGCWYPEYYEDAVEDA